MRATPYAMLYVLPALIAAGLAMYGWQRRQRQGAVPFTLLMTALAVWCICHAAGVAATSPDLILFWAQLQYAGIVAVGPLWLLFALAYANKTAWSTFGLRAALFCAAALLYIAVLTNGSHMLWWSSIAVSETRPFGSLDVVRGPLFWLHAALSYTYLLLGIALFVQRALSTSRFYQRQARLVIIGVLIPLVGNIVLLSGVTLPVLDDPTPFLFLFSGALLFYASTRYQLLDLSPIAQREVFESMPDGVIVLDHRGIVTAVNRSARQFLQHQEDLTGQNIAHVLQATPLELDLEHMLAAPSLAQSRRITYSQAEKLHSIDIRLQPLYEQDSGLAGTLLVLRDMSDQVRAEYSRDQRLRDVSLLHRIARAANSAAQTDDVLRLISAEMLRALPWHRAVVGLLQPDGTALRLVADQYTLGPSTLEGRTLDAHTFRLLMELMQAGQPQVLNVASPVIAGTPTETALQRMNMQTVLFVPLISREQTLGMLFVGSVKERVLSGDEMRLFETIGKLVSDTIVRTRLYDEAQEANDLKSAFLATVSHELRTPLTSVIGFADMLGSELFGPMPEGSQEAVSYIQHSSQHLLRLISDILDFSKMEAGHFTVDLYPVDATLVVQLVAGAMQPQLRERGLSLTLDLPPDIPLVQSNSARLEQVLTNLVANAIKFTERGGVTISIREEGPKVLVRVSDTGIGIAPEYQSMIFDVFRQVENPLTRRFGGTGLGLAICKRLIELMGGAITLESQAGVGSTFQCELHAATLERLRERAAPTAEDIAHATPHPSA